MTTYDQAKSWLKRQYGGRPRTLTLPLTLISPAPYPNNTPTPALALALTPTLARRYADGFGMHVTCSLIAGVVATTVAAPFDLLKSRVMASASPTDTLVTVLTRLLRTEVKD